MCICDLVTFCWRINHSCLSLFQSYLLYMYSKYWTSLVLQCVTFDVGQYGMGIWIVAIPHYNGILLQLPARWVYNGSKLHCSLPVRRTTPSLSLRRTTPSLSLRHTTPSLSLRCTMHSHFPNRNLQRAIVTPMKFTWCISNYTPGPRGRLAHLLEPNSTAGN